MRLAIPVLIALCVLGLAAGFGGRFHAAGDTIALARPILVPLLALLAVVALALRRRGPGVVGILLALASGCSMVQPAPRAAAPDTGQSYAAYQKNLLWSLPALAPVAADIEDIEPDFVMLQELHQRNRPILAMLRADYPHQHFCRFVAVGGVAVLSRWPATDTAPLCDDGYGLAALEVETPDGPLWLVSLHLHWPFPYRQHEQLETLLPMLDGLDGPVVIGGDFNMIPWAYSVAAIKRATQTINAGYAGGTFDFSLHYNDRNIARFLPSIPIDHILVPDSGTVLKLERRGRFGSDHYGLLARFALRPAQ